MEENHNLLKQNYNHVLKRIIVKKITKNVRMKQQTYINVDVAYLLPTLQRFRLQT